jgi:NADPH-dependent glutamate synthase beta subunit-like oxidoreductase
MQPFERKASTGKRVAVVGGGPADCPAPIAWRCWGMM